MHKIKNLDEIKKMSKIYIPHFHPRFDVHFGHVKNGNAFELLLASKSTYAVINSKTKSALQEFN